MINRNHSIPKIPYKKVSLSFIFGGIFCVFFFLVFSALGIWQVQRLNWKTNLIAHVNQRTHLPPVAAPRQDQWANVTFNKDEYRPVILTGKFLTDKNILVTAVSQNTTGYWVLTPLQTADNTLTFVNRGFIPMNARQQFDHQKLPQNNDFTPDSLALSNEQTTVIGFLRMSEKGGFFPRKNNPDRNLWYTRQLPAMAQKLDLSHVAPYFIDATQKIASQGNLPIVGLTVIHFYNNHLIYAITWFTLAIGTLGIPFFLLCYKKANSIPHK
ncbi:SURF1 family protein [Bartonella bacilliformis]|uniref:SURF1-like protein n=2 Tax=Bartonella bacilliformis TaxID=774 RepID=A0A072RII4_BARBA|nr:SURF1 family protein [Bartonella bacilliformis]KEG21339.1 hypothetical protein H710_00288 [Bartonella bacilliformis Ver097]